jgi:hypothetical protein
MNHFSIKFKYASPSMPARSGKDQKLHHRVHIHVAPSGHVDTAAYMHMQKSNGQVVITTPKGYSQLPLPTTARSKP